MATVLLFALCRQSQVLIERFLASRLPAGAISHLNYAQKVAQIPMTRRADAFLRVRVEEVGGEFGGIAGFHRLYVKVRRTEAV